MATTRKKKQDTQDTQEVVHVCIHEQDFGTLKAKVEDHDHKINGNGQKGIIQIVYGLNTTVSELRSELKDELKPAIHDLKTTISGFGRFQSEVEAQARAEEKAKAEKQLSEERIKTDKQIKRSNRQWLIGIAAGIFIVILEKIL